MQINPVNGIQATESHARTVMTATPASAPELCFGLLVPQKQEGTNALATSRTIWAGWLIRLSDGYHGSISLIGLSLMRTG
ncbi:hypothetical protein TWF173_006444 [Orbilia oligospora]|uniref:Uncharacterized protein n=1 Tax=Orbilia oligospora TaxID=2813651 RepID=A0A7C8VK92_ORBOL|nr:hypothetical protein TWF970_010409 [Orbilia oligospora]KAF3312857.1 hypothetical protein TWF173_006444 [Orbilia oligospora]